MGTCFSMGNGPNKDMLIQQLTNSYCSSTFLLIVNAFNILQYFLIFYSTLAYAFHLPFIAQYL